MAAYNSTHHIGLNSVGYTLSHNAKGAKYYQKKRAPSFVNKFGGGDAAYRDATFWQYFVQTNWRNGAKQEKWDDPGKFWKSSNVDTSQLEQLTLSKALVSVGTVGAGVKVNCIEGLRASAQTSFGDGGDSTLSISTDTTDAPIDSACTGTIGTNTLTATNASFVANQKILIHQTQGTGVGQYEINEISSYTAGTITTTTPLTYTYATGAQVLVMKEYTTVTVDSTKTLTAKAWNGTVGGIIAFYANTSTTVTGTISATGKGFRGGSGVTSGSGYQGEGTTGAAAVSLNANGNGGGGGQVEQSGSGGGGGAGGGNGAEGTNGSNAGGTPISYGGTKGTTSGSASLSTMTFGGGGGAGGGHPGGAGGAGGAGGGVIFIIAKTITVTGNIYAKGNNGSDGSENYTGAGGGGAGGSILIEAQTATLGTSLVSAINGTGGTQWSATGGAGGTGRIHLSYSTSKSGTTTPTMDETTDSSLADSPAANESTLYAGGSDGKVYTYAAPDTWTEVFDVRRLTWYESGNDSNKVVGDTGGTETAQSQGFQLAAATTVKSIQVYLKKAAGTPGDITVRIETDSSSTPSGTLANANATGTITAFTTEDYGWVTCDFATAFSLSASTLYHLVLKTAAAANDNNYTWAADASSPSYSSGAMSASTDGGSTWSAVAAADAYFRILGNSTTVNCMLMSSISTANKLYIGTGSVDSITTGDARIYTYDGTTWALNKTLTTATESCVTSITESVEESKLYAGVGPQSKIYLTSDGSAWTLSKRVTVPQNPGYVYALKEFNSYMYGAGGSPEQQPTQYYQGFIQYYDSTKWRKLYDYDFTVIKSMEFYDSYLFLGSYHGHLHVFDSSSLNPLFNFKDDYDYSVQVYSQKYFDDKLYIGLYPQDGSAETNVGVWRFDRRGLSLAHYVSGVTGYRCFTTANGSLYIGTGDNGYVYRLSDTVYETQGWYQSSYFDANLPSIPKLYNSVTIRHDPLESGESIVVYYKFKESDDWTTLGTSDTDDAEEETIAFPAGTTSNKISLKCELNCTTTSHSPKLREVIMQYSLYPVKKWQWTMRLQCKKGILLLDKTRETRTADEIRATLEALMDTETLYTLVDIDATSYSVLVTDIDQNSWVVNQDDINEDEVVLSLIEA